MSASSRNGDSQHSPADDEFDALPDAMLTSIMSHTSIRHGKAEGLGGSADAVASDDEEDHLVDPEVESTVTLVGNVRGRPVFILDDMIDKAASWIAAAETVVKRGGATKVYCFATHGMLLARTEFQ
jgi:ribose-phosphate pyrophosphokinase